MRNFTRSQTVDGVHKKMEMKVICAAQCTLNGSSFLHVNTSTDTACMFCNLQCIGSMIDVCYEGSCHLL